jgi:hypothetical protein
LKENTLSSVRVINGIEDPFEGQLKTQLKGVRMDSAIAQVFKAMLQIGMLFVNAVVYVITCLSISRSNAARAKTPPKTVTQEAERMAGCRDVVVQFARVYGHIARD